MTFRFSCVTCIGKDVPALCKMIQQAKPIKRRTFLGYVDKTSLKSLERVLGYSNHARRGLTAANDYHVTYYRSVFKKKNCVYFVWSTIEHVFF